MQNKENYRIDSTKDGALDALLQVFAGPLRSVAFPDVSFENLSSSHEELEARRTELAATQAELERQTRELGEHDARFAELARTALEYAKVYARNDVALLKQLQKVVLPTADLAARNVVASKTRSEKPRNKNKVVQELAGADVIATNQDATEESRAGEAFEAAQ